MTNQHGMQGKFCLFDPSVKVPLIVSYPKAVPQDSVCTALVEQLGLYPTLADLTNTGPVGPCAPASERRPEGDFGRAFYGFGAFS